MGDLRNAVEGAAIKAPEALQQEGQLIRAELQLPTGCHALGWTGLLDAFALALCMTSGDEAAASSDEGNLTIQVERIARTECEALGDELDGAAPLKHFPKDALKVFH
ncbi:MAG TPA: hypothetical protein VHM00_15525 [Caldimonas sp.]|jgi:hypothetical protein|nr:hypothetical protein [Caldimonas sp.]HEX2542481.1 hypothetical protein [Caldimonas sp.]